jgi:O-succinylbenzoic acid--CoA ligase
METEQPFELEALQGDWICGTPGTVFAERVAEWMEVLRVAKPGPVLLVTKDRLEFAAVFMAAVYLGRPLVLANPEWGAVEWTAVESQLSAARVVGKVPLQAAEAPSELKAGAILIPTGGSSGGVRFACHDWATLSVAAKGWLTFAGPEARRLHCVLPLFHVSGLMQLVRSFIGGLQLEFGAWEDIPKLDQRESCGRVVSLVATQLERLLEAPAAVEGLRGMTAIFMGGGPMRPEMAERARAEALPLVLSYGMTETGAMLTALPKEDFLKGAFHAGQALGHARIRIVDPAGNPCSVEKRGRIEVQTLALFKGYHGKPEVGLTGDRYRTDDLGFLGAKGELHFVGRLDALIQSGGEMVDPREVEAAILNLEGVKAALVLGQADAEWVERVVAFYVGGVDLDVIARLGGVLARHKLPKCCLQVEALPLNAAGKVDAAKVADLLSAAQ